MATWGALAVPGGAEILEAIASFGAPERLRSLHRNATPFLAPALAAQVAEAVELLEAGESWKAPSFRARLESLLEATASDLGARVETGRVEFASILARWAGALEWEESARMIEALWQARPGAEPEVSLSALETLAHLNQDLAASRERLRAGVESGVAAAKRTLPATHAIMTSAARALKDDDPIALAGCAAMLSRHGSEALLSRQQEELAATRTRLGQLCDSGIERLTDTAAPIPPAEARLLEEALTLAGRATGIPAEGNPALASVLGQWEAAIQGLLEEAGNAAGEARSARQKVVEVLVRDLERGGAGPSEEAAALRARAEAGGSEWLASITRAVESIARREKELTATVSKASTALRAASERMTAVLEKGAGRLPAARIIQARLWIEQADGLIAEKDSEGIGSLAAALETEARALKGLSDLASKRRHSQEEGARDTVKRAIGRIREATDGRQVAALQALEKKVAEADAAGLEKIRGQAEALGAAIESALRFDATMLLLQAGRIAGGKKGSSGKTDEVAKAAETARSALQKDDLAALRAATDGLRGAVHAAAPLTRPALKLAAGVVAAALVIAGGASVRFLSSGLAACRLVLAGKPAATVTVKLLREGAVAAQASYGPGDGDGVTVRLPDGRYEIYVNDRFTGRAFLVPGESEITGIPLPAGGTP